MQAGFIGWNKVEQLLTWAEKYDQSTYEAKHLIIAALVDRIEVSNATVDREAAEVNCNIPELYSDCM